MRQVSRGLSNDEIAEKFQISPATVKAHVQNTLRAMGVHSRAHAIQLLMRRGIIK